MAYFGPYFGKPAAGEALAFPLLYATAAVVVAGGGGSDAGRFVLLTDAPDKPTLDDDDADDGLVFALALRQRWR